MLGLFTLSLLPVVVICASTWFLWKSIRHIVVKTELDNIPGPPSPSFISGNMGQLRDRQGWDFHRSLAQKYGSIALLRGAFGRRLLFVHDPKAMHHIAVKDVDIFEEASWFTSMMQRVFGDGLFSTNGDYHRKQRKLLAPVFSTNHLRQMMPVFHHVSHMLRGGIETLVREGPREINMAVWNGRTALEFMGQAGLGHSFDSLADEEPPEDAYGEAVKSLVPSLASLGGLVQFLPLCESMVPEQWLRPVARLLPLKGLHRMMDVSKTMYEKSTEIFHQKKAALLEDDDLMDDHMGRCKDLMTIMLKANLRSAAEDRLEDEELVGQMSTLTFAAMDTTSNALSATLWRLAQNPGVQERLRQEVWDAQDAQGGGDIAHDDLVTLPYLDAVCRETLRVHVTTPLRFREVRKDVMLPLSEPIRGIDGRMVHEIFVPKDTSIFVSITSSNTNTAFWGPDAEEWKPERWLSPLPDTLYEAKIPGIYSNMMTFWAGGRACIGFKFAQTEMKVVLAMLLSTFTFALTDREVQWNMAGVLYPSVVGEGNTPQLPLKVGLVKRPY